MTFFQLDPAIPSILTALSKYRRKRLIVDLSKVSEMDSAGVSFLTYLQSEMARRNIQLTFSGATPDIQKIMDTFRPHIPDTPSVAEKLTFLEEFGGIAHHFLVTAIIEYLQLMADLVFWSITDLFHRKEHRKGEFINQSVLIGLNAIPLVALISLLIGLVLALQSAAQLRQFGANIFIVDLISIAMTREMGPLLTAIMVAGRSGSAIASEVATMKVTEELDALKTMALNPVRFVVIPKLHASVFTLPFLTIVADILGILGGMIVAYFYLDVSLNIFYRRMVEVLYFRDILTGFLKSLIFAGLIVLTGSYFGFRASGGAMGVGRVTTSAVVASIFLVILADSILGLILY